MAGSYDDRDGFIWMDGTLVNWRDAKVHILTHALHYASSVFEGERCYNGKIFKGTEHSQRLRTSGELLDMPLPYSVAQIDAAKEAVLKANGLTDAYVRAIAWRGAGEDMGRRLEEEPDPHGRGRLDLGQLLWRRQDEGRQARHREMEAPSPRNDPPRGQGRRPFT